MTETTGQKLREARQAHNLTIEQAVEATHIRAYYLEAMEDDNFNVLPSPVQTRGFLRLYAEYLGLPLETLSEQQGAGVSGPHPSGEKAVQGTPGTPTPAAETEPQTAPQSRPKKTGSEGQPQPKRAPRPAVLEPAHMIPPLRLGQPTKSQAIFTAIGDQLRDRRESLSLTLDEIERHIHVRKHYLQALEEGAFDRLPSSVQTRGMLNNYAGFLGIDVDTLLLQFADGLQAQLLERQPPPGQAPQPPGRKSQFNLPSRIKLPVSLRRYLSTDLLAGGGLILFLIIFAVWGTSRVINLRAVGTPLPTAPSIADILIATPFVPTTREATPSPGLPGIAASAGATQAIPLPTGGQGQVHIIVVALESTWVRVSVDGHTKFEGRTTSGSAYPYDGNTQIEVLTGDGAAVSIVYDQNQLGPMGTFGEVVDRIYTPNAILNPTPTFTPTSTQTPVPSPTLRQTATPRPSPKPPKP